MLTPSSSLTFLGFVTELVLQDLAEQEKNDATKHSLGEEIGWDSTAIIFVGTIGLSLSSFMAANEQRMKIRRAINGLKILR